MIQNSQPTQIQEAEVVKDENNLTPTTATPPQFDINAYNATLEIVRRRITILEKAKAELKKLKEMYDDTFVNDESYQKADAEVKEVAKKKKDVQARLAKQPAAVETNAKIKDLKAQIKENEESLSQELMDYYKTSGVTEIEDADGNVQEFTIVIKLKGKKKAE